MNIEKVSIAIDHWKTTDGKVFLDESKAAIHQGIIDGNIRTCPTCNGKGRIDNTGDGRIMHDCPDCDKTGYQSKVEVWK